MDRAPQKYALAVILTFVGIKMVIVDFYHVPILASLGVIIVTLAVSIIASLMYPKEPEAQAEEQHPQTGSIFGSVFPDDGSEEK